MNSINTYLHSVDYMVIGGYLIILIAFGYWVSYRNRNRSNSDNLFLAGRTLGWFSIGLTMWGTNVGPSMLLASASKGYTSGIVAGNFGWYAFIFIFLLAVVFAPKYLGAKVITLPEYMGKRFGQTTQNLLAWYSIITIVISWLALTLYAGGVFIQQVTGLEMWISLIMLITIAAFFTLAGGLKAIAYTNAFQMVFLIAVSLILVILSVWKVGGPMALFEKTPSEYWNLFQPMYNKDYPWLAIILGYPIMGVWFWCTDQSMVQSILGAKNLQQGQKGANFIGWLKILDVALFIIPGIACFVLFPNLKDSTTAYLTLVTHLFPVGMIGLIIATLLAALISTIDSALNSLTTVFTMDIYLKKVKPSATQTQIINVSRVVIVTGAIIAIFLALAINKISKLDFFDRFQAILGFLAPPMTAVFLFGVLWKKTTVKAANFTILGGTIISLGTGILNLWLLRDLKWPHFLMISFYIFIAISTITALITLFDKKGQNISSLEIEKPIKISRKIWILWIALILVMITLYFIFNGH